MLTLLARISEKIVKIEKWSLIILATAVTGLILLNVVTRSMSYAIFWIDELAIYAMIWLVMIGASTKVRARKGISVTLLEGFVGKKIWSICLLLVDVIVFCFAIGLIWLSWIWYDPYTLAIVGFDITKFSEQTFNFIYQEPTTTLTVPKFLIWLIMPITALSMSFHALVNLGERLTGTPPPTFELDG